MSADGASGPNLADLVARSATRSGDRPAFVAAGRRLTWAQADSRISARAAGLQRLGLAPGERVALMLPNVLDFPLTYFAVLRAGGVAVPINTGYPARELGHLLADSGAALLVTDAAGAQVAAAVDQDCPQLRRVLHRGVSPDPVAALDEDGATPDPTPRGGEDLAVLMYTSGTSGRPKGAMLSHRALLANIEQVAAIEPGPATATDVVLLVLPLFHIYGLNVGLGLTAWAGASAVLVDRFDPGACLELMATERVTTVAGAPPMYVQWAALDPAALRRGFAGVRTALSGAAALPGGALATIREATGVEIAEGYGLTETAPVLTSALGVPAKAGSIGRPIPGVELQLWDDAGDPVDPEQDEEGTGQIVVRGRNTFSGYWPDGHDGPDRDGWVRTGDLGFLDDDGDLHLIDRLKDLVIVSGFNVYPQEVESVLRMHPGVREAAVVGMPDEATGEAVHALVVAARGAQPAPEELLEYCRQRLARFKCPARISFRDSLPHSVTGKVSRARLRELGFG